MSEKSLFETPKGDMSYSESEIAFLCAFTGIQNRLIGADPYRRAVAGEVIQLATTPRDNLNGKPNEGSDFLKIHVHEIENSSINDDDYPSQTIPPSKVFEGQVIDTTHKYLKSGDKVAGVLFGDGFVSLVDVD